LQNFSFCDQNPTGTSKAAASSTTPSYNPRTDSSGGSSGSYSTVNLTSPFPDGPPPFTARGPPGTHQPTPPFSLTAGATNSRVEQQQPIRNGHVEYFDSDYEEEQVSDVYDVDDDNDDEVDESNAQVNGYHEPPRGGRRMEQNVVSGKELEGNKFSALLLVKEEQKPAAGVTTSNKNKKKKKAKQAQPNAAQTLPGKFYVKRPIKV
jgi:hypothetical protein